MTTPAPTPYTPPGERTGMISRSGALGYPHRAREGRCGVSGIERLIQEASSCDLVRSQSGQEVAILTDAGYVDGRWALTRSSEQSPWKPATYQSLLDFILGKPAPAEEPREVVEPKSAVGLAVEELRRREVVEPAPATARWRCEGCGAEMSADEVSRWFYGRGYWGHGESGCGPCGPCRPVVPVGEAGS